MPEVPQKFQTLAILQIAAGVFNFMIGWWVASAFLMSGGTFCSGIATCGLCPIGGLCGFASFLIVPLGVVEILVGALMLASPQSVRGFVPWLPFLQIPALFLGDLVSPVMGILGFVLTRDPEVAGYIEEM